MIRVLFIFSNRTGSCTAKRTFEVAAALHQYQRHKVFVRMMFYENISEDEFANYDIIVFQRLGANHAFSSPEEYKKQLFLWMDQYRHQTIYVYDIDDYIFDEQNDFPIAMMQHSHVALLPNEFLASLASIYQPNCHVIRTHIDLEAVEKTVKTEFDPHFTHIGWFSIAAQGIDILDAIYCELLRKWEGKVVIHAYVDSCFIPDIEHRFQKGLIIPHPRVSLREMYSLEKGLDILINPLNCHAALSAILKKETEEEKLNFTHSKSEIKYLHAGAAKKPLIATPIPAYRTAISHGVTGFLAETPEEWLKYLELLITQPQQRERIGNNAYHHVRENYTYPQVADRYIQFFQNLSNI